MGMLDWFHKKPTDEELRKALFDTVARSTAAAVKELTARHFKRIHELFPAWKTLPASVRSEPAVTKWWAEGMIGIASAAAELGEPSLLALLQGKPEENVIMRWQQALVSADSEAAGGNYDSGLRRVETALAEATGLTGDGADELLAKTYGLLGTLNYRAGNLDEAREWTLKAKAYCERMGDHEGERIYARNLEVIEANLGAA